MWSVQEPRGSSRTRRSSLDCFFPPLQIARWKQDGESSCDRCKSSFEIVADPRMESSRDDDSSDEGVRAMLPPAKVCRLDWTRCLCHEASLLAGKSEDLTEFQPRSWVSLHNAAAARQDATYDFLRKENVMADDKPRGVYHRSCFQNYTNKTNLDRLLNKRAKAGEQLKDVASSLQSRPNIAVQFDGVDAAQTGTAAAVAATPGGDRVGRRTRSVQPQTDFKLCILCQSVKMADKRNPEKLSRCEMDSTVGSLIEAARIRDDTRVLLATENGKLDFFAAEVVYHRSCYKAYTKKSTLQSLQSQNSVDVRDESTEETAHNQALPKLHAYICGVRGILTRLVYTTQV